MVLRSNWQPAIAAAFMCLSWSSPAHSESTISLFSLEWDSVGAFRQPSVGQFPVNPAEPPAEYIWRGSKSFPLLVLDQKSRGKVVDGKQLVGTFAFGQEWENGYDVLSAMDKNQDGKLTDKELDPFSLWFDEKSDGVPEAGEIRTLSEMDVVTISFNNYGPGRNGDLRLEKGFERRVAGIIVHGASVNWKSRIVPAKLPVPTTEPLE